MNYSPGKSIKLVKNSSQSLKSSPILSHKKCKKGVNDVKKVKSDKNTSLKSGKTVKNIADYFTKISGENKSDDPNDSNVRNDSEMDVFNVTVKGKVSEMRNAFEILMRQGGDTREKTPKKRLKRLENTPIRKEKGPEREK